MGLIVLASRTSYGRCYGSVSTTQGQFCTLVDACERLFVGTLPVYEIIDAFECASVPIVGDAFYASFFVSSYISSRDPQHWQLVDTVVIPWADEFVDSVL